MKALVKVFGDTPKKCPLALEAIANGVFLSVLFALGQKKCAGQSVPLSCKP